MLNIARDLFAQFHQLLTFYVEKKQKLNNKKNLDSHLLLKFAILFEVDNLCVFFSFLKLAIIAIVFNEKEIRTHDNSWTIIERKQNATYARVQREEKKINDLEKKCKRLKQLMLEHSRVS